MQNLDPIEYLTSRVRERSAIDVALNDQLIGVRAQEECDRSKPRRTHAGVVVARVCLERRMRREAAPHHVSGVTEPVEQLRAIARDARRQYLLLPGIGRDFVSFELANDLQRPVDSVQARGRCDVLPALQKSDVRGRRDRLDLAA